MPNNLLVSKINPEKNEEKIKKGLHQAEIFAKNLIDGKTRWKRIPFISDIVSLISKNKKIWRFSAKIINLNVDERKCKKCGLCAKLCPVKAITMKEYPKFKENCQLCMRCISFCPHRAIYSKIKKSIQYTSIKLNEIIK